VLPGELVVGALATTVVPLGAAGVVTGVAGMGVGVTGTGVGVTGREGLDGLRRRTAVVRLRVVPLWRAPDRRRPVAVLAAPRRIVAPAPAPVAATRVVPPLAVRRP